MTLRIDSLAFLGCAGLLVAVLRLLPRPQALVAYALVSAGVWFLSVGNAVASGLGFCFVYAPFVAVRIKRNLPDWAKALVFVGQAVQLLWIRRYVDQIPALHGLSLREGLAIIGASYMVLRQVEWLLWIDADDEVPVDVIEYTAFVLGFFTLLAGPILRFRDFRRDFCATPSDAKGLVRALHRIVNGYFKTALIAPLLGDFTRPEWLAEHGQSPWAFGCFLLIYPLYVYFNFAGYCDVVIGLGRLCNFTIPENFNRPFVATNIQEFWQRWHMTFSDWIRVHVFFPLIRFTRTGPVRLPGPLAMGLSVVVTFLLVGAWHGPKLGFLIFGLFHALGALAVAPYAWLLERVLGERGLAAYEASKLGRVLRASLCFGYLALSMLFFEREPAEVKALLEGLQW